MGLEAGQSGKASWRSIGLMGRNKGLLVKMVGKATESINMWTLRWGRGSRIHSLAQGVKLIFNRGHISLMVAFKGPNVILGLYKCNYSVTVKRELGAAVG